MYARVYINYKQTITISYQPVALFDFRLLLTKQYYWIFPSIKNT